MGASTVTTHLIIFIAVMGMVTTAVIMSKSFLDSTITSISVQQKRISDKMESDITIEVINFDNTTNITSVYIRNTGRTKIEPSKMDIYLDSERIPRSKNNRTIHVITDTDSVNAGTFDPGEELLITTNVSVEKHETHTIIVTTEQGIKDEEVFSI
ncbi:hypothetical protein GF327_03580 [Candidatus Woesearchaeota archaeon]|nr:hypothetical protein [Candidatus Woesearchaeota archaeon]